MSANLAIRTDVARANAHLAAGAPRDGDPDPLGTMRSFVRRYGDVEPRPPLAGVVVSTLLDAPFAAEWIVAPDADTSRRLVYLHGGGWVAGDLQSHRPIAAELAELTGWAVLLVDYRLAPEHPFPAAFDDCVAALAWARGHGPAGALPAVAIALAGDSAGGNLAAAVCAAGDVPDRMVLICAALDGNVAGRDADRADKGPDAAGLAAMMQLYAQGATPLDDARISPLLAGDTALAAFPPTLLQASGSEYLLSQSQDFAARLAAGQVRTILSVWPDMPHVWHAFLDLLPEARAALGEIAMFIRGSD
jgi:acetyl esterase/lipase